MGEDGVPQGVWGGGRTASGVKCSEGRAERPVPPIMAMGTGSVGCKSARTRIVVLKGKGAEREGKGGLGEFGT